MNVIPMMKKVPSIANSRIREPALPDFGLAPDDCAEFMRIRALDQLHTALKSYILSRREQKMNMIRHDNEGVQEKAALTPIVIKSFEK